MLAQSEHLLALQIVPAVGQSTSAQQSPFLQAPLQHAKPIPQSVPAVHALQVDGDAGAQTPPPSQSAFVQQTPGTQLPAQHFVPAPQSRSFVHAPHLPPTHATPAPQSALLQQVPLTHAPPQQRAFAPQALSSVQGPHVPSVQPAPPSQSLGVQHEPADAGLQPPLQQRLPPSQSELLAHDLQELLRQRMPAPQSPSTQQSPETHSPAQHFSTPPQSPSAAHALHCPATQVLPPHAWLVGPLQQLAVRQLPPQQRWPAPHSLVVAQVVHAPPLQTPPFGHSGLARQGRQLPASPQTWPL